MESERHDLKRAISELRLLKGHLAEGANALDAQFKQGQDTCRVLEEGKEYCRGACNTVSDHLCNVAGRFTRLLEGDEARLHGIAGEAEAIAERVRDGKEAAQRAALERLKDPAPSAEHSRRYRVPVAEGLGGTGAGGDMLAREEFNFAAFAGLGVGLSGRLQPAFQPASVATGFSPAVRPAVRAQEEWPADQVEVAAPVVVRSAGFVPPNAL
mmetsp:Transcript_53372/g.169685  ORF Transcript_53372/g.169685 Transcript_53372/m.169685 type:complete len:212 (-) Transcript_53372:56-691(-)